MTTSPREPLDPDAARFLRDVAPALAFPPDGLTTDRARDAYLAQERARLGETPGTAILDDAQRAVMTADHDLGDGLVVRTYLAASTTAGRPVLLYIHGGGWVSGSIALHDSTCRILSAAGDLAVVNVGYRLAPEVPYPGPLDDCERAVTWVRSSAHELGGADVHRLAVVGASSGGNLAAALALRDRDRATPAIRLLVLLYPALDAGMSGASYSPEVNGRDYFVSAEQMAWYWRMYRGDRGRDDDPFFSPLAAPDLSGLPPTILVTAEYDLLRDDGIRYARRLRDAGVEVERIHHPQIHGFLAFLDLIAAAAPTVAHLAGMISDRLDKKGPP